MNIDPKKAAARIAQLTAESGAHSRAAAILRDLADDEDREALRIAQQAGKIQDLINERKTEGSES